MVGDFFITIFDDVFFKPSSICGVFDKDKIECLNFLHKYWKYELKKKYKIHLTPYCYEQKNSISEEIKNDIIISWNKYLNEKRDKKNG